MNLKSSDLEGRLTRNELLDKLSKLGMDRTVLETIPNVALMELWRAKSKREGKPGQATPEKFSESQSREFDRVKKAVEANRRELERGTPGSADEILKTFGTAIRAGYNAADLLPKGA